jgi:hypothetical protein
MKTIKIPSTMIPYRVIVNGKEYVYEAGATVEVPDEVAIAIENSVAAAEDLVEPAPNASNQPDWNLTDEAAPGFIKNKPFGESIGIIMPEKELPFDPEQTALVGFNCGPIEDGDIITVVYDSQSYNCNTHWNATLNGIVFGNNSLLGEGADTGEPFFGVRMPNGMILFLPTDEASHTVQIEGKIVKKLAPEYMETHTFYVTFADDYIYTDPMLTCKATKEEVMNAAKEQNIRLALTLNGTPLVAMTVLSVPVSDQSVFEVFVLDPTTSGPKVTKFHTAEYTP